MKVLAIKRPGIKSRPLMSTTLNHGFANLGHKLKYVSFKKFDEIKSLSEWEPDLVILGRDKSTEHIVKAVNIVRKHSNPTIVYWNPDVRKSFKHWKRLKPMIQAVDFHFTVSDVFMAQWKDWNPNTLWLPEAAAKEVYHKTKPDTKHIHKVSFIGDIRSGPHTFRKKFIQAAKSVCDDVKVWSNVFRNEHNKVVSGSDINLGLTAFTPQSPRYNSMRDYIILATGGFLLTKYSKNMEKWMPVGKGLDVFKNEKEMKSKIKYWLAHPKKRKEVAHNGYKWYLETSTAEKRIQQLLKKAGLGD